MREQAERRRTTSLTQLLRWERDRHRCNGLRPIRDEGKIKGKEVL
jgi:hypothetical protein